MTRPIDPRAAALSRFLRDRAALFSLSADVNDSAEIAEAGMSLLEAAAVAQQMVSSDPLLVTMSERGLFESMPHGAARVVDSVAVGQSLARSIMRGSRDGRTVLVDLLDSLPPWSVT